MGSSPTEKTSAWDIMMNIPLAYLIGRLDLLEREYEAAHRKLDEAWVQVKQARRALDEFNKAHGDVRWKAARAHRNTSRGGPGPAGQKASRGIVVTDDKALVKLTDEGFVFVLLDGSIVPITGSEDDQRDD